MDALLSSLRDVHIEYRTALPLSQHSSFRIGGEAELALFPKTREELVLSLRILREKGVDFRVIGNGSNVVFPDEGMRGAVVFTSAFRTLAVNGTEIDVSAGVTLAALSTAAKNASLTGAEFAHGIPGTLGGAVFMNAGAFGGCMADICISSEYYDTETDTLGKLCGEAQAFGTRTSAYAKDPHRIVLGARLSLQKGDAEEIASKMRDFAERRRASQPLELPSAGSVFKRPIGHFAGKLIEDCGLKGLRVGGAEVSRKHAGFIVNCGGATALDVRTLTEQIKETVYRETGVLLECEIQFL